jgi:hypothetical protein
VNDGAGEGLRGGGTCFAHAVPVICPACGAEAKRPDARFCLVCAKLLREDYEPLDALRASYRMQGKSLEMADAAQTVDLFERPRNKQSETARAFLVYSLVPYLGILFFPGAIIMGGAGLIVSYGSARLGGRGESLQSIILSLIVFAFQIFLWLLLYIVPELGKR